MPISGECEHGQLARHCPFCEYEAEIAKLKDALHVVKTLLIEGLNSSALIAVNKALEG